MLTKRFAVPAELLSLPSIELLLSGCTLDRVAFSLVKQCKASATLNVVPRRIDTFADVYINGESISEERPTTANAHM